VEETNFWVIVVVGMDMDTCTRDLMHLSVRRDHGAKASQFNRLAIPSSSDRLQIETTEQVHHENAVQ
jgi:hypothetical protein